MNTNKNYKKADLTDAVLISFFAEYEERQKLRDKALAENTTIGEILRNLIRKLRNAKKD